MERVHACTIVIIADFGQAFFRPFIRSMFASLTRNLREGPGETIEGPEETFAYDIGPNGAMRLQTSREMLAPAER